MVTYVIIHGNSKEFNEYAVNGVLHEMEFDFWFINYLVYKDYKLYI